MANRFRDLFEVAPDAILEVDREGAIRLANEEAERLFGSPVTELIGRRVGELFPDRHRDADPMHREHCHERLAKDPTGSALDLWARKADGTEFPVDINLSPIQTEDGLRIMCVVRDITTQRKTGEHIHSLNDRLERRNSEVERANQLKNEFLASMSHELRTPLNAIIGFSDLLQEQSAGEVNEKQQRYLNHISHGARHLLTLINDILDLSKIEAGRMDLRIVKLILSEGVEEVFTAVRPLAAAKSLQVDIHVSSGLEFHADRTRFKQILYNLLSNAVKFTPVGGTITVEAYAEGSLLRLTVGDTGVGISEDEIETIFETFHQAAETKGVREGAGLGLAITKRLVEMHRGRIWVESEVGHHRPTASALRKGQLPQATIQGEAHRAQAVHREERTRHTGNPELEVEQPQMNAQELLETARALVADNKGLLAMDESDRDRKDSEMEG